MRIVLDLKDYIRTQIILKKINRKNLDDEGLETFKVRYYELCIQFYIHEKEHMEAARSYQVIYDTVVKESSAQYNFPEEVKVEAFKNFVTFLFISPYGNETVDLLHHIKKEYRRELENHSILERYVGKFLLTELMPLNEDDSAEEMAEFFAFKKTTEHHSVHLKKFFKMIIQHNLRVIEQYYARIKLDRLSALIGVGVDRCEHEIADMVINKSIVAKINRIEGIVTFKKKQFVNDRLNVWNADIKSLLGLVEKTTHLINRART